MKLENKSIQKSDTSNYEGSDDSFNKRGYYFHADEDFREDPNWGTNQSADVRLNNSSVNTQPDKFTLK